MQRNHTPWNNDTEVSLSFQAYSATAGVIEVRRKNGGAPLDAIMVEIKKDNTIKTYTRTSGSASEMAHLNKILAA